MNDPVANGSAVVVPTGTDGPPPAAAGPSAVPVAFPRAPGETPRACAAFTAYFALGQNRTLAAVAEQLGEHATTVKTWSARFRWSARISDFHAGLLRQQVEAQLALHREHAGEWARRTRERTCSFSAQPIASRRTASSCSTNRPGSAT